MDIGIEDIWFHDSQIHRVIERCESDELAFEVMYPVDWEKNQFEERTIVFTSVLEYAVHEGPFDGKPAILQVLQLSDNDERVSLRIETSAGYRTLQCGDVQLRDGWGAV